MSPRYILSESDTFKDGSVSADAYGTRRLPHCRSFQNNLPAGLRLNRHVKKPFYLIIKICSVLFCRRGQISERISDPGVICLKKREKLRPYPVSRVVGRIIGSVNPVALMIFFKILQYFGLVHIEERPYDREARLILPDIRNSGKAVRTRPPEYSEKDRLSQVIGVMGEGDINIAAPHTIRNAAPDSLFISGERNNTRYACF